MIAYDAPENLATWPRVSIYDTTLIVDSFGLARLTGHTLTSQEIELHYVSGEKETRKFMMAV